MSVLEGKRARFAGHETFAFRYQWLHKAARAVGEDPQVFQAEDAMVRLGVGKNMVKAIRYWGNVTGILQESANPDGSRMPLAEVSPLGQRIFGKEGWDPYLEDVGTLWLLHWSICTRVEDATTWHWAFSYLPQPEFSKAELSGWLMSLIEERGWSRISEKSLGRDIDCFLRCYVPGRVSRTVSIEDTLDCPLVELGLIREFGGRGSYLLDRCERPTLPDAVFCFAMFAYLRARKELTKAIPIDSIAFAPGSPGRIFALSEDALLQRLERLEALTGGALAFDDTAGLRQVFVKQTVDPFAFLGKHYRRKPSRTSAGVAR